MRLRVPLMTQNVVIRSPLCGGKCRLCQPQCFVGDGWILYSSRIWRKTDSLSLVKFMYYDDYVTCV